MVKRIMCCSMLLGLLAAVSVRKAGAVPMCDTDLSYCCVNTSVSCTGGYSCTKAVHSYTLVTSACTQDGCAILKCKTGSVPCTESCVPMAQKSAPQKELYAQAPTPKSWSKLVEKMLDVIAAPANAANCWSGGNAYGVRNGANKTDANGTSKQCEAKLHVCYANGSSDSGIPCTINTTSSCDNACNNTTTASQIACGYTDCTSRCYAARVSGYPDTCD